MSYSRTRILRDFNGNPYNVKQWNVQPKPYTSPLPYSEWYAYTMTNTYGDYKPGNTWLMPFTYLSSYDKATAENKAASKLAAEISDKANILLNVVERKQSMAMIEKRALQLVKFGRHLRKFEFRKAAQTLGIKQPKGASRSKQFADNWLEFHFGWSPLIGDIHTAGEILQKPLGAVKARGRGRVNVHDVSGNYPVHPPAQNSYYEFVDAIYRVQTGCTVKSVNSDLWLMNQMGFVNPAVIAWEAIPFSFVVDWFTGFGAYLEGLTGTVGLEIADSYTTRKLASTHGVSHQSQSLLTGFWEVYSAQGGSRFVERSLGHLSPQVRLGVSRVSPTRGITAISLLLQVLKR